MAAVAVVHEEAVVGGRRGLHGGRRPRLDAGVVRRRRAALVRHRQSLPLRGVPSGKKIVARSFHRVTQQISGAWIDRFFKIWVHMKALILLFHRRYDS